MELSNSFVVGRPIEAAWSVLTDVRRIAPCMPGAQLTEIDGDDYHGLVKVKVGPVVATYQGTATIVSVDDTAHEATIEASGRDPRQGNANAVITAQVTPDGESAARVDLVTNLILSGKLAGFGKGAIEDVAANLLTQFASNLETMLAEEDSAPLQEKGLPASSVSGRIVSAEPEPVDLAAVAAGPMLRRLVPAVVVAAIVFLLGWLALRRRR